VLRSLGIAGLRNYIKGKTWDLDFGGEGFYLDG